MVISLDAMERSGLTEIAEQELRSPRDQLRIILRRELQKHGLLTSEPVEKELVNYEVKHEQQRNK